MSVDRPDGHAVVWRRPMAGCDPGEAHRAPTPLELLFDLCFVVAIAQAVTQLRDAVLGGETGPGLLGYAMVFFAIWWAWMNFTWFASAYDTDDVLYRLLTLVQMGGALVLAAGVPAGLADYDFTVITFGYVVMRLAMVAQWLRAAAEHPGGRPAALRYAVGISVVQIGWLARLALPDPLGLAGFVVLVAAEIAVPVWAEFRGRATRWHSAHIAGRYGRFTIIVLGQVILGAVVAVQSTLSGSGLSDVLLMASGALLVVFGLWWIYFAGARVALTTPRTALAWGYGHYVVFGAIAALGAGLQVAVSAAGDQSQVGTTLAAFAVAVPVAVTMGVLAALQRLARAGVLGSRLTVVVGALVVLALAASSPVLEVGGAVLGIGVAVAATLAANLIVLRRHQQDARPV